MPAILSEEPSPIVGVRLPKPIIALLRAEASRRNVTVSWLIRSMIDSALRERARKRRKGARP